MVSDRNAAVRVDGARDKLLDGFRALAVLGVIAGHALAYRYSEIIENNGFLIHQIGRLASPLADTGVYIFFAISGYIITSLMLREKERQGTFSLAAFYVRRSLRILPPFAAYLAVVGLLASMGYIIFPVHEIGNAAAFTCNTGLTDCSWFVAHTWSLAVEEQYYLVWPLLFTLLAAGLRHWLVAGVAAVLIVLYVALPHVWHSNLISFACIAAGASCALRPRWHEILERAGGLWTWLFALAFVLGGPFILGVKIVEATMPLLALFLLFGARSSPLLRAILESAPLQFIGKISYSLYLWQQLFLGPADHYRMAMLPVWLLPVVAWLSLIAIERPCMRLSHRWSRAIVHRHAAVSEHSATVAEQLPG